MPSSACLPCCAAPLKLYRTRNANKGRIECILHALTAKLFPKLAGNIEVAIAFVLAVAEPPGPNRLQSHELLCRDPFMNKPTLVVIMQKPIEVREPEQEVAASISASDDEPFPTVILRLVRAPHPGGCDTTHPWVIADPEDPHVFAVVDVVATLVKCLDCLSQYEAGTPVGVGGPV